MRAESDPGAPEVGETKRAMRREILERIRGMSDEARRAASDAASARLLEVDEVRMAGVVLVYRAMRLELDPASAVRTLLAEGIRVAVPRVDEATGEIEAIEPESHERVRFVRDRFGTDVPLHGRALRATELEAVVVPGLAFDRHGRRLGRGGGHYDRLLVRLPERCRAVGLGFHCQLVDAVPSEPHDRRVSAVVTERETLETS